MLMKKIPGDMFQIQEASTGMQGIEKYKHQPADLVFLDLTMPDMDGFETLEQLKLIDSQVKVVVVSADIQESSREKAMQLGALDFLQKPASQEMVQHVLDAYLS
jgi:CheY-like chemotaxis protein